MQITYLEEMNGQSVYIRKTKTSTDVLREYKPDFWEHCSKQAYDAARETPHGMAHLRWYGLDARVEVIINE